MEEKLINLLNYLDNNEFDSDLIHDDIDSVLPLLKTNKKHHLIEVLRYKLSIYLSRMADVCASYIDFLKSDRYSGYIINDLLDNYYLPFRTCRDPLVEQHILSILFNKEDISLTDAIYYLAVFKDKSYLDYDTHRYIYYVIDEHHINFASLRNVYKFGSISKFPSNMEIVNNMDKVREDPSIKEKTLYVGQYAEYISYKHLNDMYDNVIWVSKELGDGYGYDIAVVNETGKSIVYEVKGTYSSYDPVITENEMIVSMIPNKGECDYRFLIVFTEKEDTMVEVYFDGDTVKYNYLNKELDYKFDIDKVNRRIRIIK